MKPSERNDVNTKAVSDGYKLKRGGHPSDWVPKKDFHPGGRKGKLHRELGISEDKKIPSKRLEAATHSKNPEIRRDAIRAKTMKSWHH